MAAPVLDGPQHAPGPRSWPNKSANGSRAEDAFSSSQGNVPRRLKGGNTEVWTRLTFSWKEVQSSFASPLVRPGLHERLHRTPPSEHESPNPSPFRALTAAWLEE